MVVVAVIFVIVVVVLVVFVFVAVVVFVPTEVVVAVSDICEMMLDRQNFSILCFSNLLPRFKNLKNFIQRYIC